MKTLTTDHVVLADKRDMPFPSDWQQTQEPNTYYCDKCRAAGKEHEIANRAAGPTDWRSCWGSGVPMHVMYCTGCFGWTGPWVDADLVGGGY